MIGRSTCLAISRMISSLNARECVEVPMSTVGLTSRMTICKHFGRRCTSVSRLPASSAFSKNAQLPPHPYAEPDKNFPARFPILDHQVADLARVNSPSSNLIAS